MFPRAAFAALKPWERAAAVVFFLTVAVFGIIVLIRSAFLDSRRTDVGCYLRAGWALRAGGDLYSVADNNGLHFAYPPVAALLFVPLADAPGGADRPWMLPYAVSVGVWYLFNVACVLVGVHWIASVLEESAASSAIRTTLAWRRRWWVNRIFPLFVCIIQLGNSLARGQITPILILCVARMFSAAARGRSLRSALWLAAALCLKMIPAFLVLFPLWRRDRRALGGTALGILVGFVIIPSLVWGVPGAFAMHRRMLEEIVLPAMSAAGDQTRAQELTNIDATDHQSIGAILHNYQHWSNLATRPAQPDTWVRFGHWATGGFLTLVTLWAAGWRRNDDPIGMLLLLGVLFVLMILTSPLSHLHYFAMAVPLVMGLHAAGLEQQTNLLPGWPQRAVLILAGVLYALPTVLISWQARRQAGLPLLASLLLWALALWQLRRARTAANGIGQAHDKLAWNQAA